MLDRDQKSRQQVPEGGEVKDARGTRMFDGRTYRSPERATHSASKWVKVRHCSARLCGSEQRRALCEGDWESLRQDQWTKSPNTDLGIPYRSAVVPRSHLGTQRTGRRTKLGEFGVKAKQIGGIRRESRTKKVEAGSTEGEKGERQRCSDAHRGSQRSQVQVTSSPHSDWSVLFLSTF